MFTKNKLAKLEVRNIVGNIGFGEMLQALRNSQSLTQVEMACKLEISKQDLCNIEKGRKLVSVERAIIFAKLLNMPLKTFAKYALQDQLTKAGLKSEVTLS
jgi:transcriptional regulator with XRE-family HTH domain